MNTQKGQAMIIVLFVTAIAVFALLQVTVLSVSSISVGGEYYQGMILLTKAEGYLEEAALRFLRDPSYTGEAITDNDFTCTSQVNDFGEGKQLLCRCQKGNRYRQVQMNLTSNQGAFIFSAIEETP